jgi:hypothetical protein
MPLKNYKIGTITLSVLLSHVTILTITPLCAGGEKASRDSGRRLRHGLGRWWPGCDGSGLSGLGGRRPWRDGGGLGGRRPGRDGDNLGADRAWAAPWSKHDGLDACGDGSARRCRSTTA